MKFAPAAIHRAPDRPPLRGEHGDSGARGSDRPQRPILHHELAERWRAPNNHGTCEWIPARVLRILDDSDNPET